MDIYVIRHGIAADLGGPYGHDSERPLTELGIVRTRKVAQALRDRAVDISLFAASPFVRAQETASIFSEIYDRPAITLPKLAAGCSAADILDQIRDHRVHDPIGIVGHEPDLQLFIGYMIGITQMYGVPLKKAGVAHLNGTLQPGQCELVFLMTPRMLLGTTPDEEQ
jgi:phosphohistidine phosphatase